MDLLCNLRVCFAGDAEGVFAAHISKVLAVQVTRMEFALLWATYLAIMYTDLERGIGAGIVMATLYFAYSYAQVRCKPDM